MIKEPTKSGGDQDRKINRRDFTCAAAATATAFTFIPSHVLGGPGKKSANEKLNIACIGVGGRGQSDVEKVQSENIVALCDVDFKRAAHTFKRFPKARQYKDFRVLLDEQKDIDAVVVATPDHMHAVISMTAIKMGKHVYCEKPLTHSVFEAREIAKAAKKHKVATQMGNQGQASESRRRVSETIWDGAIGPVREVHVWTDRPSQGLFNVYWPQGVARPAQTPPVPSHLSWDLWLGPAPERPYHPAYLPFVWRGWWDFGTGALGDIGCHAMDPIFRALKLGHPTSVEATSARVNTETYPVASMVTYQFPARGKLPPVKLTWYDGGLKPPRPDEMDEGTQMGSGGTLYIGDKGKMLGGRLIPEAKRRDYKEPPKTIPRSPGHHREWIDACKGGKPAGSNFDFAGPLTEVVLLGNIALRKELRETFTTRKLLWDGKNMNVTNVPEANKFLHTQYRKGWSL